ncbi:MAG: membrane protein insertase YidC [Saprospiraceae bacterium]
MDRNNIIGFVLIFVVLMLWSYFNTRQHQAKEAAQKVQDSIALIQNREDSIRQSVLNGKSGVSGIAAKDTQATISNNLKTAATESTFKADSLAKASEFVLENDLIKITLNSYGGSITKAELKNYSRMQEVQKGPDQKSPVYLLSNPKNKWNLVFDLGNQRVNTKDIIFQTNQKNPSSIEFSTSTPDGKKIIQSYSLEPNSFILDYEIALPGSENAVANKIITLEWQNFVEAQEKNVSFEKTRSTIHFKPIVEDEEHLKFGGADLKTYATDVKWISNAQQFFNTSIIAEQSFKNIKLETTPSTDNTSNLLGKFNTTADLPLENGDSKKIKIYIGPNEFSTLKAQGFKLEDQISFGASILGTVNKWVIRPVFNFLSNFFSNKGIVILLLTLVVKLCLFPLSYKMLHSQSKMAALKPELAHLKEKFKDDPQQIQMESMKVYREFGVNPLGGCLPMVLQMPIWLALYQFFPASIEFRQSSFLWANDLSSYDVFAKLPFNVPFYGSHVSLFSLVWVISTLVFTFYSTKDQDFSMNPAMKYMQYFMPVFFLFFFNSSAAGLTAYMAFSNILNIAQTLGGKALLFPEAKMKEELKAAKAKPKKKGGFQERLSSMMDEQKQKLEQQKNTKR